MPFSGDFAPVAAPIKKLIFLPKRPCRRVTSFLYKLQLDDKQVSLAIAAYLMIW
jgi:hypothetical protein